MKKPDAIPLLPSLLRDKLIPWASDNIRHRMIVARPAMSVVELPDEVRMEKRKLKGKRLVVRGKRQYGNMRISSAEWPEEELFEIETPKLVCVINGQADYRVGEYLLHCNPGYFIFIPPQTPHPNGAVPHLEGERRKDGFCELLQIVSYHRGIQCIICRSHGSQHAHVKGENYLIRNEQANDLFHLMMEEAVSHQENHELVCGNLLTAFMLLLQREINAERYLLPGPRMPHESSTSPTNDFSAELNRYILAHLGEQLTLEDVARQMHLSRSQFALRIREETGKTFIEHLTACRLEEAQILLRESEWTIITVSEFVGFKSSTYFHRLFQERMGMTPGDFRLQSRKTPEKIKKDKRKASQTIR
jgi:AraC-like DNA-binding protein